LKYFFKLSLKGLIKLLEENVNIICKKSDEGLIQSLLQDSKNEFLKNLKAGSTQKYRNFDTNIVIDKKNYLPEKM